MTELDVAASDGARISATVDGTEGSPLLLIPGLGATRVVFAPLLPLLSPLRVAVYDQRGIGASEVTPGPYTTEQLGDDAAVVLDALAMHPAAVLGASFGGMVAQQLAVRHPGHVATLVLAATGPGPGHVVEEPEQSATDALLGKGARSPEEAYRRACTVLYSRRFQDEHPEFIEQQIADRSRRPVDGRAFKAQFSASRTHDAWDGLASLTVPTLVMHGSEDRVMPLANARALAEHIPHARLVVVEGAGHLFFHEQPQRTAEIVRAFVTDAAAG